jgi:transmembrane sensor
MTTASETSDTAASWLIRLESEAAPETWDAFQVWLDADPRHRAAFIRLRVAWTQFDRLKMLRPADGTIDADLFATLPLHTPAEPQEQEDEEPLESDARTQIDIPARRRDARKHTGQHEVRPDRRRWLAAAAVVAAVGLLAAMGTLRFGWNSYETDVGGREQIVLADGSTVELNTDSELRARITRARRDIVLIRGEALFHVAHDTARPFYVTAGNTVVRAVGTAFSVRIRDSEHVDVLVAEGRVAVGVPNSPEQPTLPPTASALSAGESATVVRGALSVKHLQADDVNRKLAWTAGHLSFRGETLTEAVQEFNRYSRRRLAIADPSITLLQVGGTFQATDPESFVAALERSFGVTALPMRPEDSEIRLVAMQKTGGQPITRDR